MMLNKILIIKYFVLLLLFISINAIGQDTLCFEIKQKSGTTGSTVCMDVTTKNFKDVESLQFSLSYDATLVVPSCPATFVHPSLKSSFFGDLFNCNNKDKGYLNVVWAGDPITIPNDSVVFTICFDVIGDAGNKSPIIFNGNFISGGVEVCYKDVSPCSKSILKFNQGQIDLVSSDFKLFRSYCDADGAKKGSITFYGAGGTPPYSYTVNGTEFTGGGLSDGQRVTIPNLDASKNFEIILTDAVGRKQMDRFSFDNVEGLKYNLTKKDPSCFYGDNGSIKINPTYGWYKNYTYQWSNLLSGRGLDSLESLTIGKYYVTITNQDTRCQIVDSTELSRALINMTLSLQSPAPCNQPGVFGFVNINASGGVPKMTGDPYKLTINRGQNFLIPSPYVLGQRPGKYEISVSDSLGCFKSDSIVIPFSSTLDMTADKSDILCKGAQNGSVVLTVSPYNLNYVFFGINDLSRDAIGPSNPRADSLKLNNLLPGQYAIGSVVFINGQACRDTARFNINEPPDSLKLNPAIIQPGCNVTGSITLNTKGGNGGYNYIWNPPQSPNTTSLSNLTGGTFRITVTDSKNCRDTIAITLNSQGSLATNLSTTKAISCSGKSDGKLKVSASGGSSPYTYVWKNSSGQIISQTDTLVNIGAGIYYAQVTDKDGCKSLTDSIILTNPPIFSTIKSPPIAAKCHNSRDGIAEIKIAGGSNAGYSFEWQKLNNSTIIGRDSILVDSAGTYIIRSINSAGCGVSDTIVISAPSAISYNQVVVQPKCDILGSITINPSGGTPGYFYKWNLTPADTFNSIKNLDNGNYQVTVTDANKCPAVFSQMLNPSGRPQISAKSTNITCYGAKDGSLTVTLPILNSPFDILWRDSTGNTAGIGQNLFNLGPGRYTVVVTDINKCASVMQTVFITQPDSIAYTKIVNDARCFQENGNATIRVKGGNAGYTFDWKNASNQTIGRDSTINLKAGTYTVVISNTGNCPKTDTIEITQPGKITFAKPDTINVSCVGKSDGRARIINIDPTLNFTWSNGFTGSFAFNLPKGRYWVIGFDNKNCTSDTTYFNIAEPEKITLDPANIILANPKCFGQNNGSLSVASKGGSGNGYTYSWSNGRTSDFLSNLVAGKYIVTITDGGRCSAVDSLTLTQPDSLRAIKDAGNFKNPDCINLTGGSVAFVINGGNSGPKQINWQTGVSSTTSIASGLRAGRYCATITDSQGCTTGFCDSLTQSLKEVKLTPMLSKTISCAGSKDGRASVAVSGNNVPFNVVWKDVNGVEISKDSTVANIGAGKYYVFVKELNTDGCQNTDSILITEPPKITFPNPETRKVTCFGLATGQAAIVGSPPGLTYSWSTGINGLFAANFTAGMSWVIAKDNKNCVSDTIFFDTGTFEKLSVDNTKTQLINASCFGNSNGSVKINATGGTGISYTYRWQDGTTGPELTNLAAGTYKVTISDSNNCQQSDSVTIAQPAELVASLDLSKFVGLDCKGTEAGRIGIKTTGGNPGIKTIKWQSGLTIDNGVAIGLKAGNYCATVTDNFGCKDTFCYTLIAPPPVRGEVNNPNPPQCNGGSTCISVKSVSGGTGNRYTFQINNGRRFPIDSCVSVTAGQYFISFIDSTGCSVDTIITINQPSPISVNLGPDIEMSLGQNPVLLKVDVNSEFRIDTVIWTPKSSLNCLSPDCITLEVNPIITTAYVATVIDQNGCKGSDEIIVKVNNIRNVYFPNIFTPNRDGFNDYFQAVVGPGVEKILSFSIYDRWGNMVFDKSNFIPDPAGTDGWDGMFNNVRLDPGVFVYFARARFIDGKEIQYTGSVTLADKVRN
ncbi:MAG: gliding motility-associated C-terminal domain-containing protein [Saprospiraceae bacterium]